MRVWRRRILRALGVFVVLFLGAAWLGAHRKVPVPSEPRCYITGAGELRVCHPQGDEGEFYRPGRFQIAYNTQIIALGDDRYATVLHSEAKDQEHYHDKVGGVRPGDSIKAAVVDVSSDHKRALTAPAGLDFRIWGNLDNVRSPLFYAFDLHRNDRPGLSGGANPMVVRGRAVEGVPYYQMFYLGVTSDDRQGVAWRNVLLQARTKDFVHFDVLGRADDGTPHWAPFTGSEIPVIVSDTDGKPIQSNQAGIATRIDNQDKYHPAGSVTTNGIFGTVLKIAGRYYYFYPDQDAVDPSRNHLYVRTADDISTDRRWSPPRVVLDIPPEVMVRVTKAIDMDRWVVFYTCLRTAVPFTSDLCLQYTGDLSLDGPKGIGGLRLFDGPVYTGVSNYALGLAGDNRKSGDGSFFKVQPYYLSDPDGALARPPDAPENVGGLLTWNDMPQDFNIFGAATDWGTWTVNPVTSSGAPRP